MLVAWASLTLEMTCVTNVSLASQAMQAIDVPVYDFTTHQRSQTQTRRVEPADVIVIEGILVLHIPEVCRRLNMKVYVDTDDDVRLARRCERAFSAVPCRACSTGLLEHPSGLASQCQSAVAGFNAMWLCAGAMWLVSLSNTRSSSNQHSTSSWLPAGSMRT